MRIQNVRDRLVRAAQSAMKRLHSQAVPHDESTETTHDVPIAQSSAAAAIRPR